MIWGFEFRKEIDSVTGEEVNIPDFNFWPTLIQAPNKFEVNTRVRSKERKEWIERECKVEQPEKTQ
jgi:hypothetical protein